MNTRFLALLAFSLLSVGAVSAQGAVVQPVDKDGKAAGPAVALPDCKSCTVEKTGPNSYTLTVPDKAKQKADDAARQIQENPPGNKSTTKPQ